MTCEKFRDRVFDFLQGMLEEREAFEAHRASCATCARSLQGIELNEQVLSSARVPKAPADLWPRIAAAISQDRVVPFRRIRYAAAGAVAAAALLVVAIFASIRPSPAPRLNLVVREVGPESQRAFRSLVPRYEDVDATTAMVDTLFRSDY